MELLSKLKTYFNISGDSQDNILNLVIAQDTELCGNLGIDQSLIFSMCVEDYSMYLKSGNTSFTTSQASEGINRYSDNLRELMYKSMRVKIY